MRSACKILVEVLTAVKMTKFFWVVTQSGLLSRYQRFGETYRLHLQGSVGYSGMSTVYIGSEEGQDGGGGGEMGQSESRNKEEMLHACRESPSRHTKKSGHLRNVDVNGKIILKWISREIGRDIF
jgi:hypothetical protein